MSHSEDIRNLFRRFGGNADGYQEFAREDDVEAARQRWPMLSMRVGGSVAPIPPAGAQVGGIKHAAAVRKTVGRIAAPSEQLDARHPVAPALTRALPLEGRPAAVVPAATPATAAASTMQPLRFTQPPATGMTRQATPPAEPGSLSALFLRLEATSASAADPYPSLRKLADTGRQRS